MKFSTVKTKQFPEGGARAIERLPLTENLGIFTEAISKITALFTGNLQLSRRLRKDFRGDEIPEILMEGRHTTDNIRHKAFGVELVYKDTATSETVSMYLCLYYRLNALEKPYPDNMVVAADLESGRLSDVNAAYGNPNSVKPFLFIEPGIPEACKAEKFKLATEQEMGSDILKLAQILDGRSRRA